MALLAMSALAGCAEEEKPVDVPEGVRQGVLDVLHAVDPDAKAEFSGETCNTDPLADPPDDHRWRLEASFDGTAEEVRAAGLRFGWQPQRFDDGTLALVDYHRFGEPVDLLVRDGSVRMHVERDCTSYEPNEVTRLGTSRPEPTRTQGERLGDMLDEIDQARADIVRELRVRPKDGVYVSEDGPRTFVGCAAGERSGAKWFEDSLLNHEATRDDELGPTADRLVDALPGWEVVEREEGIDSRDRQELDLLLRSEEYGSELSVDLSFWGEEDGTGGVRIWINSTTTPCVAVDAE